MPQADQRPVAGSVEELLGTVSRREPLESVDGKSGATMERVVLEGEAYVLKHVDAGDDWVMRAVGDLAGCPITCWASGLLDRVPDSIDHTLVGAAREVRPGRPQRGAILMHDVGEHLVPGGGAPLPLDQHLRFLDHMAELHASFWGWRDQLGLTPRSTRIVFLSPRLAETERALGHSDPVPTRAVPEGWARLRARGGPVTRAVLGLHHDPGPLDDALATLPSTLVHGDWKAGNLGSRPDGRTVLLDWTLTGEAPPGIDLAHYLCLNRALLPESKEQAIDRYRDRLEQHGVPTEPWWDRHMALALLTVHCSFGWEKALGEGDEGEEELAWWEARSARGLELIG